MTRLLGALAALLWTLAPAAAQQVAQAHLYCMNGRVELRLTRPPEGRSVCHIRSFGHESTARDWARRNLAGNGGCGCQ